MRQNNAFAYYTHMNKTQMLVPDPVYHCPLHTCGKLHYAKSGAPSSRHLLIIITLSHGSLCDWKIHGVGSGYVLPRIINVPRRPILRNYGDLTDG